MGKDKFDDPGGMTEAEIKSYVDGSIDEVAQTILEKAESRALDRLGAVAGENVTGRYSASKGWSPRFGGGGITSAESQTLSAVKALGGGDSERLERRGKQLHTMFGVRGEDLDLKLLTEEYFRADTLRQLLKHPKHLEGETAVAAFNNVIKADMYGSTNASGGYAVPDIVGNEVLKLVRDASQVYSRSRQVPMTSDTLNYPDENTAVTVNWVPEGSTLTQGEPVLGQKSLTAKKIAGRATFSIELLEDSNVRLIPFLQSCFAERIGGELDFQAMQGPGTVFTGLLAAVSVGTTVATNGTNGTVLQYTSTTTKSGLVQIYTGVNEGIQRNDNIFVCGPGVYAKILGMVDTNGQPIVKLGTLESSPAGTIFGRPIIVTARMVNHTVGGGTVSVGGLYYGSPSALIFGVRQGLRWDISEAPHFDKYQADARLVGRFGFCVGVPQAWVRQADIIV